MRKILRIAIREKILRLGSPLFLKFKMKRKAWVKLVTLAMYFDLEIIVIITCIILI